MHLVQGAKSMKSSMTPVKKEIFNQVNHNDLPHHFTESRKIMKSKSESISVSKNKQRINYELIDD